MDKLITSEKYNIEDLLQVNACRLYLQVISLANICEGYGHRISKNCLEGIRDATRISKWKWPYLPRPPTQYWKTWQRIFDNTFLINGTKHLRVKLGKWISEPHQKWNWFLDKNKEILYHKKENNYYQHPAIRRNLRHDQHHPFEGMKSLKPKILHRTTVKIISDWHITSMGACENLKTQQKEHEATSIFPP